MIASLSHSNLSAWKCQTAQTVSLLRASHALFALGTAYARGLEGAYVTFYGLRAHFWKRNVKKEKREKVPGNIENEKKTVENDRKLLHLLHFRLGRPGKYPLLSEGFSHTISSVEK